MVKKDVSHVSYAKQYAQHKRLQLSQRKELMVVEKLQNMISICLNVFTAGYVKSRVLSLRLFKGQIFYLLKQQERNFIIIKRNYLIMVTDGSRFCHKILSLINLIDNK